MQAALRSYITSGIAIVGVSVIAMAPIAATPRDVTIANPAVQLTASPFEEYQALITNSLKNIQGLIAQALAAPPPPSELPFTLDSLINGLFDVSANIANFQKELSGLSQQVNSLEQLTQMLLQAAQGRLQAGDVQGALDIMLYTGLFVAGGVAGFAVYPLTLLGPDVEEVAPSFAEAILNAAIAPDLSVVAASGEVTQNVLNELKASDPQDILGDLIFAPAILTNGLLNGAKLQTSIFGTVEIPGFLTDATLLSAEGPGPIALAIQLGQFTRALLGPTAATAVSPAATQGTNNVFNLDVNETDQHAAPPSAEKFSPTEDSTSENKGVDLDADKVTNAGSGSSTAKASTSRLVEISSQQHESVGSSTELKSFRDGIHDGVEGLREGARNVVKAITGHGDDHDKADGGNNGS
jgi:hypothetical protein